MNMNNPKLLPCPLCGGESLRFWEPPFTPEIFAPCCNLKVKAAKGETVESLIKRWNRRAGTPEWIDVKERLPELHPDGRSSVFVLGYECGEIFVCQTFKLSSHWGPNEYYWRSDSSINLNVTHWKPLPEGPDDCEGDEENPLPRIEGSYIFV